MQFKRLTGAIWRLLNVLVLLAACQAAFAQSAQPPTTTLNLSDADINTLISTVSQITGKNFVVDPRVKGKVTVISSTPMTAKGIYRTFLSVLQVHGYAAVPSGQVIKIVPEVNAKQEGGAPAGKATGVPGDEIVTRVVKVENVPAAQLVPILRPLVPQYGHLAAYPPSNALIISDRASNVRRIVNLVHHFDQGSNQRVTVVPLQYASAANVVTILNQILQSRSGGKGDAAGPDVAADERTNSILVSGDAAERARLARTVRQLDVPSRGTGASTNVVYLHFADATRLAKVLNGYLKNRAQSQSSKGGQQSSATSGAAEAKVIASKDTNALVINAPPQIMAALRSIINQLDIRRAQVLVQAVIAEVSANKSQSLGINWAAFNSDRVAAASLPGVQQNTVHNFSSHGFNGSTLLGLLQPGGLAAAIGKLNSSGTSFALLLQALASDSNTNILSTPTLVTMDNQKAEITVGQQVPFITGSYTAAGTGSSVANSVNPFQTIERQQVGITLTMTPQINAGNQVELKIDQKVSSLAPNSRSLGAVDLITNNRELKTAVSVHTGEILVLGGLIDDQLQSTQHAVPLLSDIPLLGSLFRYRDTQQQKRNLMVFIRPVILRNTKTANYYTRQKYNDMRALQLKTRESVPSAFGKESVPVLKPHPKLESKPPDANSQKGRQQRSGDGSGAQPSGPAPSQQLAPGSHNRNGTDSGQSSQSPLWGPRWR